MRCHAARYILGFIIVMEEMYNILFKLLLRLSLESGRTLRKTYSTRNYEGSFSIRLSSCQRHRNVCHSKNKIK